MELTCGQIVDSSKLIPKKLRIGPKFQLRELLVWEKFILNQEAFGWIGSRTKKPSGGLVHGSRSLRVDRSRGVKGKDSASEHLTPHLYVGPGEMIARGKKDEARRVSAPGSDLKGVKPLILRVFRTCASGSITGTRIACQQNIVGWWQEIPKYSESTAIEFSRT